MLIGLSIGLSVALLVYIQSNEVRIPAPLRELTTEIRPAVPQPATGSGGETEAVAATNDARESASGDSDEPALSFYTRLRNSEVVVPASAPAEETELPSAQVVEIQAGSFPTIQGADTRQATLALLGIASRIDPAIVDDVLHYRVIIGPLSGRAEVNSVARHLDEEKIEFMTRQARVQD